MKDLSLADLKAAYLFAQKEKKEWEEQYNTLPEEKLDEVKKAGEQCKYWTSVLSKLNAEIKERIYLVFKE